MPRRDSKALPHMPWYPADFRRDTNLMSRPARLIYRELLDLYWEHRGEVPFAHDRLALAIGCPLDEWQAAWPEVEPFWTVEDGRLRNRRADHELGYAQELVERRREAGRRGAQRRWDLAPEGAPEPAPDGKANGKRNGKPNGKAIALANSKQHATAMAPIPRSSSYEEDARARAKSPRKRSSTKKPPAATAARLANGLGDSSDGQ